MLYDHEPTTDHAAALRNDAQVAVWRRQRPDAYARARARLSPDEAAALDARWQGAQARARHAVSALALEPWDTTDHAADLRNALAACPVTPLLAVVVRTSRGERWAVTRHGADEYQIAHGDGRHHRGTAAAVVALMEGA